MSNYKAWRQLLTGYGFKDAKKRIIRHFFFGKPVSDDLPQMWALAKEISRAVDIVLSMEEFRHLGDMFADRRCPTASRLSYAPASLEDSIITHVDQEVAISVPGATVISLQFDGLVTQTPQATADDVATVLLRVGAARDVKFTSETFDALQQDEDAVVLGVMPVCGSRQEIHTLGLHEVFPAQ